MHALNRFVFGVLGPCQLIGDRSWLDGWSTLLEMSDTDGRTWFVKRHRNADRYDAEVNGYRRWVPALGDRAPTLRACDDDLQVLVLSAVPGAILPAPGPHAFREAGALLRRLHDQPLPPPGSFDFAASKQAELEYWAARADGLLQSHELDFARSEVRDLNLFPDPPLVPCHLDYSPRNWLVHDGKVHIIDFEWMSPEPWVYDLGRLWFGSFHTHPNLKNAFLRGYGRSPSETELMLLIKSYPLTAVRHVILANRLGKTEFEAAVRDILARLMRHEFDP